MKFHNKKAFSLAEIVIAVILVVAAGIPILKMVTTSRTETTSSVNYFRAMELANEAIEWANVTKFSELEKLEGLSESIVTDNGSSMVTKKVTAVEPEYKSWLESKQFNTDISYPNQYIHSYFYRIIEVKEIKGDNNNNIKNNLLKKVTVTVKWNEGTRPSNIDIDTNRTRQIQLSVLVINDDNLVY